MANYIAKQKRNKKVKTCLKVLLCLVILGGAAYAVWYFRFRETEPKVDESPTTVVADASSTKTDSSRKDENSSSSTTSPAPVEVDPKNNPQNEGEDPNKSATITGAITRADVSGEKVIIRVNIDQYLSGGTCNLTMTSGSKSYSDVANVADSASTSTCEGFDVPISKLSSGDWTIAIKVTSGNREGVISGKVTVQ